MRFNAKASVLFEGVRHHVREEEGDLFADARRLFAAEELEALGSELARAKQYAPTRPHPRAPDQPPANLFASSFAAILDRSRDLLRTATARARSARERSGRSHSRTVH